jgi:hypothetical protein
MTDQDTASTILTWGYSLSRSSEDLRRALVAAVGEERAQRVIVVDIRRSRVGSRNPHARGRCPSPTGAIWVRELGNCGCTPKWDRGEGARAAIEAVAGVIRLARLPVCLVCAEADARKCHRREVAEAIGAEVERRTGQECRVVHLP